MVLHSAHWGCVEKWSNVDPNFISTTGQLNFVHSWILFLFKGEYEFRDLIKRFYTVIKLMSPLAEDDSEVHSTSASSIWTIVSMLYMCEHPLHTTRNNSEFKYLSNIIPKIRGLQQFNSKIHYFWGSVSMKVKEDLPTFFTHFHFLRD